MSEIERDRVRIQHVLQAILFIEEFVKESEFKKFINDNLLQSAVVRQFEIIGEASANISDDIKEKYPEVQWRQIKGFRNFLIHEYFRVDSIELWKTIEEDLPAIKGQLLIIIDNFPE